MPIDRAQLAARLRAMKFDVSHHGPNLTPDDAVYLSKAERDALLGALGAEAEPRGWQAIATAPKDRPVLLLERSEPGGWLTDGHVFGGAWSVNAGYAAGGCWTDGVLVCQPTHWQSWPAPPSSGREEQENEK